MSLDSILIEIAHRLGGKVTTDTELNQLRNELGEEIVPLWFVQIMKRFALAGADFSLTEDRDLSKMGVQMRWLDCKEILEEARDIYPGKAAVRLGYLPIGGCLEGSGDPYFIFTLESSDPPLVRIPHDIVDNSGQINQEDIEVVSNSLSDFFAETRGDASDA